MGMVLKENLFLVTKPGDEGVIENAPCEGEHLGNPTAKSSNWADLIKFRWVRTGKITNGSRFNPTKICVGQNRLGRNG